MKVKKRTWLYRNVTRKMGTFLITAAVITACGGSGDAAAEGIGIDYPAAKVYALMDPGDTPEKMAEFAAMTTVDGLVYRARWRDLKPTAEGSYIWNTLDDAFGAVQAQNKQLTVHIGASGGAWPDWLKNSAGAVTYSYLTPLGQVTDPLPWDAVFLNRYDNFVAALAAQIQSRGYMSLLHAISVGAPVAEMSLVGCRNNVLGGAGGTVTFPYSRTNYLSAWSATIGSYRDRFDPATTTLLVSAPVNMICYPDNDGSAFYSAVMTAALPTTSNLAIFAADLNALGSSRVSQLDTSLSQQLGINLQTIWSATSDPTNRMAGTLQAAVCKGLRLGARYFEIYKSDLSSPDPAIQGAINTARTGSGCIVYPLTATVNGSGGITASSPGYSDLVCVAGNCSQNYDPGSLVTFSPSPGSGYSFTGWSGACTGTGSCTVTMDTVKGVTANFADTTPPDTTITSYPANPSESTFSLSFTATETGSTFECSFNNGVNWLPCSSPYNGSLGYSQCGICRVDIPMMFDVRAADNAGNTDLNPASYSWTINCPSGIVFDNVIDGGEVQLKATDLTGDLIFSRPISFTIKGGYDSGYSSNTGQTNIHGTVTISGGAVIFENVTIL